MARRPAIVPVDPGKTWRCLWPTCPDFGRRFAAPANRTNLEDVQHHHRTVHNVHPQAANQPARRSA